MQKIIIFSAILATALAAPGYYLADDYHVPLAKSTFTTSSQAVDHGSTHVLHAPVYPLAKTTVTKSHQAVDHGSTHVFGAVPVHTEIHVPLAKTTVTNSNQIVNHGGTAVVHAPVVPVVHTPVVHTPVVHAPVVNYHAPVVHTPVTYHAPVVYRAGDSAVSHHSSSVHETVPVVHHLPLYAYH